jgi:glycosyltransferase involved in cell wall biosynthesis
MRHKTDMNTKEMCTLSVIIPCYNEAPTIAAVVEKVQQSTLPSGWQKEIIVVDDGSGADTVAVLRTIEDRARVIYRQKNSGKGAVVKEGLRHATGDYCIIQDADLELSPAEYRDLFRPIIQGEAEAVFGYRILAARKASSTPMLFYGGFFLSLLYDIAFLTQLRDIPCCYKLFPRRCIPALIETPSEDFVFDAVELTYVIQHECSVVQVPVSYSPRSRAQGKKLRFEHGVQCVVAIILLRLGLHRSPITLDMGRIARFLIAGGATTFVSLTTLYLFTEYAHVWYLGSSAIAFVVSYLVNFSLQKFWTFKNMGAKAIRYQLPFHLSLALCNFALNTLLLFTLVEWAHVWYLLAQVLAAIVIAIDSFYFSRKIFS